MGHIKDYLLELIRLDGRGERQAQQACSGCLVDEHQYRCQDCLGESLSCGPCIVKGHVLNPFHNIEVWFLHNLSLNLLIINFQALEWQIFRT